MVLISNRSIKEIGKLEIAIIISFIQVLLIELMVSPLTQYLLNDFFILTFEIFDSTRKNNRL